MMLTPGGVGAGILTPTETTAQEQQPWDSYDSPKRTQPARSGFRQMVRRCAFQSKGSDAGQTSNNDDNRNTSRNSAPQPATVSGTVHLLPSLTSQQSCQLSVT